MPPKAPKRMSPPPTFLKTQPVNAATSPPGGGPVLMAKMSPRVFLKRASILGKQPTTAGSGRNEMENYFDSFVSRDGPDGLDAIGEKGIQRLCKDLSIVKDSFEMYALVWKLGITRGGCIPRTDWITTMYNYKIENAHDLKFILADWVREARGAAFAEFCSDIYDYIRGEDARFMSSEVAVRAWEILFSHESRIRSWIQWYSVVYKRDVTRDLWRQLPIFFSTVSTPDDYRVEDKWPSAIDSYVEWSASSG